MKALVLREHGGMENLQIEHDFPDPEFGPKDVVVRVKACSLNYHDIFTRRGMPGIKIPMPVIMGMDVAGDIEAVGDDVENWSVGDRVLVDPANRVTGGAMGETVHGGLAELCRVPEHQLIRLPKNVEYKDAAALPVAYGTAIRMIRTIGKIQAGERVLILGASGGVGVCCVSLAKLADAYVVACAGSDEKAKRLIDIGADQAINYSDHDFTSEIHRIFGKPRRAEGGGVDVVVNFTGGDTWVKSLKCLRRGGRMLTCGATAGFDPKEDIRYIWSFELTIQGSNGWAREDLTTLLQMIQDRRLKVTIDKVFDLEQATQALAAIEGRRVFGKLIVQP